MKKFFTEVYPDTLILLPLELSTWVSRLIKYYKYRPVYSMIKYSSVVNFLDNKVVQLL